MSHKTETSDFTNLTVFWNNKSEEFISSEIAKFKCSEAHLVLAVPPEHRFRYRYDTEMSGTHGSLQGIRTGKDKSVPTVQLMNFSQEALIRVSLVTCHENGEYYPHPHSLFVKEKLYDKHIYENWENKNPTKTGHYLGPHYIRVDYKSDYTARFEGMCIINSKKENYHSSVRDKLLMRLLEQGNCAFTTRMEDNEEFRNKVEKAVGAVDVDFVSLCFEAFRLEGGKLYSICPPIYSEPIGNAKSAKTGKLKISRINKCFGSCKGGDEIWMLVEKINKKGLVVKFWEECNGKTIWQSTLEGDDLILHHQYAIIFKTPAYRDTNIASEVEVLMRLERGTQPNQPCDYSEAITFVYEPSKSRPTKGGNLYRKESNLTALEQIHIKRPRTDPSSIRVCGVQGVLDDMELGNLPFEEATDSYIEQILFNDKDSMEFDQAWSKFNVEEFLQFLSSDDMDMPLQRDGVSLRNKHRRELLNKLYLFYSKLDENEMKKLTDDVSNFRVSKEGFEANKRSEEKEQVKDAASTLLTLRSRAVTNNSDTTKKPEIHKKTHDILSFSKERKCYPGRDTHNDNTDVDVQAPVRTSVIKNHLSEPKLLTHYREVECNVGDEKMRGLGNEMARKFFIGDARCSSDIEKTIKKEPDVH